MTIEEQRVWFIWFISLDEAAQMRVVGRLLDHSSVDVLADIKRWAEMDRS